MRWYAMSTRFLSDPKVEQLGEKHGPVGPLVIVSLLSHAALQETSAGEVERTFRATAHEVFTDAETVGAILDDAIESGLCHGVSRDVQSFKVTFPAWKRHQATFRKAKSRAGSNSTPNADVTDGHTESHDVTNKTGQDKTEEQKKSPLSYLLADLVAENDPDGKRPAVSTAWVEAEDRMLRLDGRKPAEAERLIRWTLNDSFWRVNVRSMPKFREKYGQLYDAATAASKKAGGQPSKRMTPESYEESRRRHLASKGVAA